MRFLLAQEGLDLNADIALEGVITRVEFINPHSWLHFRVTGANGESVDWRCEMRGATVLRRSGWTEEMFVTGSTVSVTGSPDRGDATTCYLGTAVFADGSSVDRYGQLKAATPAAGSNRPARLAGGEPNISGDWAAEQQVMTDPRAWMTGLITRANENAKAPGTRS